MGHYAEDMRRSASCKVHSIVKTKPKTKPGAMQASENEHKDRLTFAYSFGRGDRIRARIEVIQVALESLRPELQLICLPLFRILSGRRST